MKSIATVIILLTSFCLKAQVQITDSLFNAYLLEEINNINLKLFNAAIEQKLPVYSNDSFSRTLTTNEIRNYFSYEQVIQITESDDPYDVYDSTYIIERTVDELEGLKVIYKHAVDATNGEIRFTPYGVGPVYMVKASGIDLGLSHLFLLKMTDLDEFLSHDQLEFLKALISQNSQFGDFRLYADRFYSLDSSDFAYQQAIRSVQSAQQYIHDNLHSNKIAAKLAEYNRHISSIIMARIAHKEFISHKPENYLFKDSILKTPYRNPQRDLRSIYRSNYEHHESLDYIDTIIVAPAEFFHQYDFTVRFQSNDYIFDFIYVHGSTQPDAHIYMSFNSVKSLFPEHDRIIWEAFLKDLFKA